MRHRCHQFSHVEDPSRGIFPFPQFLSSSLPIPLRHACKTRLKNHLVAFLGEFVGTFLFLFFAFAGTQTANFPSSNTSHVTGPDLIQLLYISLIFGFSLAINVWVFFRISGGLFNPAVTLALCICGVVPPVRSIFVFVAQIVGGIAAAGAVQGLLPGDNVLFAVRLTAGTSKTQGLFLEMFFTLELVFTVLMLAAEKTKATFIAPVGIGLALFVAELPGVYWTGGALNPARAFGPAVILKHFDGYHWIYWIGPILGALLASGFYKLLKFLNYEEVNGTQDLTAEEEGDLEKATHSESAYPNRSKSTKQQQQQQRHKAASASPSPPKHRSSTTAPKSEKRLSGRSTTSTRTRVSREGAGHYGGRENRNRARCSGERVRYTNEAPMPPPKPSPGSSATLESHPLYGSGEAYVQDLYAQDGYVGGQGMRRKEVRDK